MLKRGKDGESINSGGQEIRMHTMGPKKSKRQFKEGVNMVKILEKPPPSPEYQGTFQFYDDTLPLMLETLVTGARPRSLAAPLLIRLLCHDLTAEQWDEIMTKVNSIWRPIHEESVAIQTARSWWDYTMVGAYRRSKRQTELAKQVLDAAANITGYFKQVVHHHLRFVDRGED